MVNESLSYYCGVKRTMQLSDDFTRHVPSYEPRQCININDMTPATNSGSVSNVPWSTQRAGPYIIGPLVKKSMCTPFQQCLVQKGGTDKHYLMRILVLNDINSRDRLGLQLRTLFHNEYSILSMLKGMPGVVQLHDFFKDNVVDKSTGAKLKRMCTVLECTAPHGNHNMNLVALPLYLKEKKKLSELEALVIVVNILQIVSQLHAKKIVHKDLKLANVMLDRRTLKVTLVNFYLAKLLISEGEMVHDCRGSTTYTPPEVIRGQPFLPKPCDVWGVGVMYYMLLFGQSLHPYTLQKYPEDLFNRVLKLDNSLTADCRISLPSRNLVKCLLCQNPKRRLNADEALWLARSVHSALMVSLRPEVLNGSLDIQMVPDHPDFTKRSEPEQQTQSDERAGDEHVLVSIEELRREIQGTKRKWEEEEEESTEPSSVSPSKNNIREAMLKLGATSINPIRALSFNPRRS